jgi:S1-C subfamily serine protease
VRIEVDGCGFSAEGSGFFVGPHEVVTNRHVVDGYRTVRVVTSDGTTIPAKEVGVAGEADLARVLVEPVVSSVADLANEDAVPGASVRIVGFPLGGPVKATSGRVVDMDNSLDRSGLSHWEGASHVQRVSAVIEPGNSGGPLLDQNGGVVGVVYAVELRTGFGLAIPATEVRKTIASGWRSDGHGVCP